MHSFPFILWNGLLDEVRRVSMESLIVWTFLYSGVVRGGAGDNALTVVVMESNSSR